jgi:hypothetical protein
MTDKERGDELTNHHNQGQSDYGAGKHEPPHSLGILDGIIQSDYDFNRMVEDNQSYDQGYDNARNNK